MPEKEEEKIPAKLKRLYKKGDISQKYYHIILNFFNCYKEYARKKANLSVFNTFIDLFKEQFRHPFHFRPFHKKIQKPFDYYAFGNAFIMPMLDLERSTLSG